MTAPVFLVEPGELSNTRVGSLFSLRGSEARHAAVVGRRGIGETIDLVDTCGVRATGVICKVAKDSVEVEVSALSVEPPASGELILIQALAKGDRDEMAIEAATEIGVDRVVPWQATRSVVVWRKERAEKSRAGWELTVRSAAKQSRRAWVPVVAPVVDVTGLLEMVRQIIAGGGTVVVTDPVAAHSLLEIPLTGAVAVVVGPEGGISLPEQSALEDAGAISARLGPHVLRTSTAGPVALTVLSHRLGRW